MRGQSKARIGHIQSSLDIRVLISMLLSLTSKLKNEDIENFAHLTCPPDYAIASEPNTV